MSEFAGFPVAALDFYDDLEVDNTKSYWEKHKATYDNDVKAPMMALVSALAPEFALDGSPTRCSGPTATCGSPRTRRRTRPTRARTSPSRRRPAGTSRSRRAASAPAAAATTCRAARLAAYRDAVADDKSRRPADPDHQQAHQGRLGARRRAAQDRAARVRRPATTGAIDLLRHKSLYAGRSYGFEKVIHTPDAARRGARRLAGAAPAHRVAGAHVGRLTSAGRAPRARRPPALHPTGRLLRGGARV